MVAADVCAWQVDKCTDHSAPARAANPSGNCSKSTVEAGDWVSFHTTSSPHSICVSCAHDWVEPGPWPRTEGAGPVKKRASNTGKRSEALWDIIPDDDSEYSLATGVGHDDAETLIAKGRTLAL